MDIGPEIAERLADEELIALIAEKDPVAFELFYERHGGIAFSVAYRILGERAVAEEVTQDAFMSIWRRGASFDRTRGSARSWMLRIVRNQAIDFLRSNFGKATQTNYVDDMLLEQLPSGEITEEVAMRREGASELLRTLAELPVDQSRVIELAYFGGLSQTQIATMLGIPLGTVKGRTRLGFEKIRGALVAGSRSSATASA